MNAKEWYDFYCSCNIYNDRAKEIIHILQKSHPPQAERTAYNTAESIANDFRQLVQDDRETVAHEVSILLVNTDTKVIEKVSLFYKQLMDVASPLPDEVQDFMRSYCHFNNLSDSDKQAWHNFARAYQQTNQFGHSYLAYRHSLVIDNRPMPQHYPPEFAQMEFEINEIQKAITSESNQQAETSSVEDNDIPFSGCSVL